MLSVPPIISTDRIAYHYRGAKTPALADVSLDIPGGSCFGLLGPNGAGKSTLISLLNGVLKPQSGSILIEGEPSVRRRALTRISAFAPQDLAFYPKLSVSENLSFFCGAYDLAPKSARNNTDKAIEACCLEETLSQRAATLSGGQKRRLNLAIALLNTPRILYLDEPTVGIDAQSRQTILKAISTLNSDGMTIVYTSHYMEEVEALCDEIAIINHGRLALRARKQALLDQASGRGLRFSVAAPLTSDQAGRLTAFGAELIGPRELLAPAGDAATMARLMTALSEADCELERMTLGAEGLEAIYLDALRRSEMIE